MKPLCRDCLNVTIPSVLFLSYRYASHCVYSFVNILSFKSIGILCNLNTLKFRPKLFLGVRLYFIKSGTEISNQQTSSHFDSETTGLTNVIQEIVQAPITVRAGRLITDYNLLLIPDYMTNIVVSNIIRYITHFR